jgi:hypothetical protein
MEKKNILLLPLTETVTLTKLGKDVDIIILIQII